MTMKNTCAITYGVNTIEFPVAGMSVDETRLTSGDFLGLGSSDDIESYVNGQPVVGSHRLRGGDRLGFWKEAGAKGIGKVWTEVEFIKKFGITSQQLEKWIADGLPFVTDSDGKRRFVEVQVDAWLLRPLRRRRRSISNGQPANSNDGEDAVIVCEHRKNGKFNVVEKANEQEEFYDLKAIEAAELFGVSYQTVARWIKSGTLRGTSKPLRTSLQACREYRDQILVEPPAPVDTGRPRPYSRNDRKPWEFIDPSRSGKK